MKIHRKDLYLITAFIFALIISGCKKETSLIGSIFKIPPGILTKSGIDPLQSRSAPPPMADIFWSNTISEQGYAQNSSFQPDPPERFVQFYRAITRLSVGANYRPRYWILRPNTSGFLKWTEVEDLHPESRAFWIASGTFENQEIGPLTMIYNGDLINRQNLTIVVTDLEEQGLNMSLLADLIRNKLLTTDDYAAAVIALKLPFNGLNYKPNPNRINNMVESRHSGLKPIYAVVSGPRGAVSLFISRFSEQSRQLPYSDELHIVTTTQKGQIQSLALSEANIPQSAVRSDFARIERYNKIKMSDLWNIRTGRDDYEGFPDRIWNLQNMTDSMVDHFKLVADDNKPSSINELLDVLILQYKTVTGKTKNGQALWQLNVHFNIPQGCDVSELEAQIKNYRYLTLIDPPGDKADAAKKKQKKQKNDEPDPFLLQSWRQNDAFIARDLEAGKPDLIPGTNTAQVYVAPKDMKRGALESSVICFDLIVRVKKEIEIPQWVNDFDDASNKAQDKTLNFRIFINNLLKGESAAGAVYSDDELIRIPIVLFNMPSAGQGNNKRR